MLLHCPVSWRDSKGGFIVRDAERFSMGGRTESNYSHHKYVWALLIALMALPGEARPQVSLPNQVPGEPYKISVNVDMVILHASVRNRRGNLVSGLREEDFQVFEDGAPQPIQYFSHEDIPVTVGLVVDNSGSMRPKRQEVIASALAFVRSSNPQDQMFAVSFNEKVTFGLPADMPFTDQEDQLAVALSRIASEGLTALYDAVTAALEHLTKGNRDKKVLIVISDGGDNASQNKLHGVTAIATKSDAIIYTIGVFDENDPDRNTRALQQLSKATGGESFLPKSLKEVVPICERIARDIRTQYTIIYVPANTKQDGAYRAIQVKARAPRQDELLVRTRAGYYAPLRP
jgi:Ca-activated chloride channel homolog